MSAGASERTTRGPRSWWFDPRLAIGIALVIASVVGVLLVVTAADGGVRVYVARSALSPGDRIKASDLVAQSVRLGGTASRYLGDDDFGAEPLVVTRPVAAGELVAASAVGTADGERVTSVVVTTSARLARSVLPGAVIDVWSASEMSNGVYGAPTILVSSATVVRIIDADGIISGSSSQSVEILVPKTKTARALEAIANKDAISLVPTSIALREQG